MNSFLLNRALGSVSPHDFNVVQTTRLVHHLDPAPGIRFSSRRVTAADESHNGTPDLEADFAAEEVFAHKSGVKCLAIDQFEGR